MKTPGTSATLVMMAKMDQTLALKTQQRLSILGRMQIAELIEKPEADFAAEVAKIEKDELFRKLYFGDGKMPPAFQRQKWPSGELHSSFYEIDERRVAGSGERVPVEKLAEEQGLAVSAIKKMGRENFEKYFLRGQGLSLGEISKRLGFSKEEILSIHDFLLDVEIRSEFEVPSSLPAKTPQRGAACIAHLKVLDGEVRFEFYAPYWARGLYHIRYDLIDGWKTEALSLDERKRLPFLIKRMESLNLRQSALYRVFESLSKIQMDYLSSRIIENLRPISLRGLARRLDLSPSTVSRALSRRSVRLPWEEEVPVIFLLPGRRRVLREIVETWLKNSPVMTDAELTAKLKAERGISVSRRTVNAVRHEIGFFTPKKSTLFLSKP